MQNNYKPNIPRSIREKNIKQFRYVYYRENQHSPKVKNLPNWMKTYGYWLDREDKGKLPHFYREFKQGTIVMVDFGARIGAEMSLGHFAVVLSKKDSKFNRNIIVVPLSSKQHERQRYLPLGQELFTGIYEHAKTRIQNLEQLKNTLKSHLSEFSPSVSGTLTARDVKYLFDHGIDFNSVSNSQIVITAYKESEWFKIIKKIQKLPDYQYYPSLKEMVDLFSRKFSQVDELERYYNLILEENKGLDRLKNKLKKYNKDTYADVGNIQTVSKLRVTKFSNYKVSENVAFNDTIIDKIKSRLNDFI